MIANQLPAEAAGTKVKFDSAGILQVDGKPFFPLGIFVYQLTSDIMADLHQQQFNTIINIAGGFDTKQLDYIQSHGLMTVVPASDEWVKAAKEHPSLLGWYLQDEPEGHGQGPENVRQKYLTLQKTDPNHPIGLCHYLFKAIADFKDACDFTMSDVYPVTANRDVPLANVGAHIDEATRVHGRGWPTWAWIQVFGGPQTDGGKWAQPLPLEVRCMAYIALVHGATGILYFSYWPQAPITWNSLGPLNKEIRQLVPWLVARGRDGKVDVSDRQVHTRMRQVGRGGIILAVNTDTCFTTSNFAVPGLTAAKLDVAFEGRSVTVKGGRFSDRLGPYETRVYTWGDTPVVELAGQK